MRAHEFISESHLRVDVPNEDWLASKIEYAQERPRDRHGVPYMGATTATVRAVRVPVDILRRLPGMKSEQSNVRQKDLDWLVNYMGTHNRLPPLRPESTDEYLPFINVAYNGEAWVNEGNHRIMAAAKLGWKDLPVEVSYFDGGERIESGAMYPPKIGLGQVTEQGVAENFADGKNPGRKGLAKRVGVDTKASVSSLRNTAKHSTGEKQRMAHWLANMKAGKAKARKTNEAIIGYLHFPKITIGVDEHAIERAQTHGIDPHDIDTVLKKLSLVIDQLSAMEVNNTVWVYDAVTNVALGLRRISSADNKFKLKTVIGSQPYNGATPVINIANNRGQV